MPESLLTPGNSIAIPLAADPFIAKDRFVLNTESRDQVLISVIQGDFLKWFAEKRETPAAPVTLRSYELQRNAPDTEIIADLGGEGKSETTLAAVFWLLEHQKCGEPGTLANNGWGNIFYIRDAGGVTRTVYVHWCGDAWNVEAARIGRDDVEWPIRDRAFARLYS